MTDTVWIGYEQLRDHVVSQGGAVVGATLIWQVLVDRAVELGLWYEPEGEYSHCSEKVISATGLSRITLEEVQSLRDHGLGGKSQARLLQFLADTFGSLREGV